MKKHFISKSEIASITNKISLEWGICLSKIKQIESIEIDNGELLISKEVKIVKIKDNNSYILLPLLTEKDILARFPSIEIDMGAIKAICNGANVMRPGIVKMDEFKKDDIVTIKDVNHKEYLAIGIALLNSNEAKMLEKGAIINNLHYIGDKFWSAYRSYLT